MDFYGKGVEVFTETLNKKVFTTILKRNITTETLGVIVAGPILYTHRIGHMNFTQKRSPS